MTRARRLERWRSKWEELLAPQLPEVLKAVHQVASCDALRVGDDVVVRVHLAFGVLASVQVRRLPDGFVYRPYLHFTHRRIQRLFAFTELT